ncbi:MAG TPA: NAD synthetase [Deltaproteobacteria bacterium]|nr:NAD synthetase [Deltaproteobacteria bacterium]
MSDIGSVVADSAVIVILIWGIKQFRTPRGARQGNMIAALALGLAIAITLYRYGLVSPSVVIIALLIGSAVGWIVAMRVDMIQIPSMVAFQHGAGGVAAFLVSYIELTRVAVPLSTVGKISGVVGLIVGAATFSGSMIASAKLANKMKQTPTIFPAHNFILILFLTAIVLFGLSAILASAHGTLAALLITLIIVCVVLGVVFAIRIGGADMPVLISFLNATAGLAAAFVGVAIQNRMLIACGATVAASGSILTYVMCRAMNRSLMNVFVGIRRVGSVKPSLINLSLSEEPHARKGMEDISDILRDARSVIVIPGYGMALAHAQFKVVELMKVFEKMGKAVKFAIHPVAGRMPGHMNVLLAEADVSYDKLYEMDEINREFAGTDLVLVVGACDVVNPAAIETEGTPISGMPILNAHEAKHVIVCNLDEKPGYSGVPNTLYEGKNVTLFFGDAKETMDKLSAAVQEETA